MCRPVANGILPSRKDICSPVKSEIVIFGFCSDSWLEIESIAGED